MNADRDLILFANEAFYAAFAAGDVGQMDQVWAAGASLACLHPGAPPLFDREAIMESWRQILEDPAVAGMQMRGARIVAENDFAVVVCFETLGGSNLVATNGFVREGGVWRMALHQAGPCPESAMPLGDQGRVLPVH